METTTPTVLVGNLVNNIQIRISNEAEDTAHDSPYRPPGIAAKTSIIFQML